MGAIHMNDDKKSEIDLDRCIGCGLCVAVCKKNSLRLVAKGKKDRKVPVKNGEAQMMNMLKKRGTINTLLWDEVQGAYRHKKLAGVGDLSARLMFRSIRQIFRK